MQDYNFILKQLEDDFIQDCYLNAWVQITGDRDYNHIPYKIKNLQSKFIELMNTTTLFPDSEKKACIKRMKRLYKKLKRYYNYLIIKCYFKRKFKLQ